MSTASRTSARPLGAVAALVGATAVWGSTFVVTKQALPETSPASFLVWRFGIAALVLVVAAPRRLRAMTRRELGHGAALGAFLAAGFLLQTHGLLDTDAGVSGFLTGAAVVLTPVVAAAFFGESVGRAGWAAVVLATVGMALLVLRSTTVSLGAALTVAGAACFALHIASLSRWATAANAVALTATSVCIATALCALWAIAGDGLEVPSSMTTWWSAIYVAVAATCVGFVVQAWAQSRLTATTAAVVMTMEPFFAAVFAATAGHEALGSAGVLGGVLVVGAMFVAELGPRGCCDAQSPRIECC
ncbi:permease [Intrasporangium oryzae NRRL B-24470]|uniref:Permease n=1 Tax=Intrasporangium oryzae NRRL B-24470 TaxID=1386089 RepID=W9G5Z3_9MICO|nr:DMT family transporter [Intrasporangium oryzae]EWT00732.1 permease [Intrasporangium oryzae NRRL B-24470]